MPTLLRMPDELYTDELAQVIAPQYALRTFQDALNGRPFYDPGFRSQVLEFLVLNYRIPAHMPHMLDDAFHALMEDLKVARVLLLERMPMMRAYHWQPGAGDEKGQWVVPTYIFAEHRNMLQLALDNAKSNVPNAGVHEAQDKPTPKVPYRKASGAAPAALKPGADLVDQMAKHTSGEAPLSPEESIKLRKELGKMNESLNPGEQFMVPDYSPNEQAYLDEKNLEFSNDIGMVYSPAAAALGLPTRAITEDESRVAGAVNTGLAFEGAGAILTAGVNRPAGAANASSKAFGAKIPPVTNTAGQKISEAGYLKRIERLESLYGSSNVHSVEKHGAQTTGMKQYRRVQHKDYPNPTTGAPGNKTKTASKFLTNKDHYEVLRKAILQRKSNPEVNDFDVVMDRNIGVNIKNLGSHKDRGPYSAEYTNTARVRFDPNTGKIFTAFPIPEKK